MKAQVFYEPEKMSLEEVEIPQISAEEVLVKVKACGICGSDLAYYFGNSPLETDDGKGPLILGHEFAGEVVEVGEIPKSLDLFSPGDRVIVNPVQQCNACEKCAQGLFHLCENGNTPGVSADGGFAEYSKSKYTHLYKLPDNMSFEEGAITEPLACSTYGVEQLDVGLGDTAVVFGPGTIGILMVQLIKSMGAGKVILAGTRDYPLEVGKEAGADNLINVRDSNSEYYTDEIENTVKEMGDGKLADKVIVATGSLKAMHDALDVSGPSSTIVYFGLPGPDDKIEVPALDSIQSDKNIKFSWLAPLVWPEAIAAIKTGKVDVSKIVTHSFSLEDAEEGIKFMKHGEENKIKGVVKID